MKPFAPPKRKIVEVLVLPVLLIAFYFIHPVLEAMVLFAFGFIWNWSASNDLSVLFESQRYRFSMVKTVFNLQALILKPFGKAPQWVKSVLSIFPAGIFWSLVIYINDSVMPWWATFIGSLCFELVQIEVNFIKKNKEIS